MSDVRIYQTNEGGDVQFVNGQPTMADGLESSVFLSLFGGNRDDDGGDSGKSHEWWADADEPDPAKLYRSETQHLLRSIPAVPANLTRIEDAANRDLAWMLASVADAVVAQVTIPKLNAVTIAVSIEIDGKKFPFTFGAPWSVQ